MEQYFGYWENEMNRTFASGEGFDIAEYHEILCPETPDFLSRYIALPMMQRLSEVGLLCGTDWTKLFNNRMFYSRLDHSIGCALIVWNYTKNKRQTLAALFHDVSTPAFSHVIDFRNGDALKQESTENLNEKMITENEELNYMLKEDGIYQYEVRNYHKYPIADNNMPRLSADRLEYMYPSGAALGAYWSTSEVRDNYSHIKVCINEEGQQELSFDDMETAFVYAKKFADISLMLQHNEDKVAMQMMADIVTRAINLGFISENDLYSMSEKSIISLFDDKMQNNEDDEFTRLFYTYCNMNHILHTDTAISDGFNVRLDVKKRYVDPIVCDKNGVARGRLSAINSQADKMIKEFLAFEDTLYGSVPWLK